MFPEHFYSLHTVPSMNQMIVVLQDGFKKLIIACIIFCNQYGQFVSFYRNGLNTFGHLFLVFLHSRFVGKRKPESRAFTLFRFHTDSATHTFYQCLADRKPQSGSLGKRVQLDETPENVLLLILRNSTSGIGYIEIQLILPHFIAKTNAAFFGKLNGICHKVNHQLGQTVLFRINHTWPGRFHKLQFHRIRLHSQQETTLQFPHQLIQFNIRVIQLQRSRLNLRQIKNITDELQQQGIIVLDDADIFLLFLFFFGRRQYPRETDNSIQRGTDFMAHIGQEGRL